MYCDSKSSSLVHSNKFTRLLFAPVEESMYKGNVTNQVLGTATPWVAVLGLILIYAGLKLLGVALSF